MGEGAYLDQDTLFQQTSFLSGHYKVMSVVLVVHNILKVYVSFYFEISKELLVKQRCYTTER